MRLLPFLTLLVLLTTACGKLPEHNLKWPARLAGLENFSSAEEERVLLAIEDLNARAGKVLIDPEAEGSPITIRWANEIPKLATGDSHVAGRATIYSNRCTIDLSSLITSSKERIVPVVWHELGHCAGLSHDASEGEVMYSSTEPLSTYDLSALRRFLSSLLQASGL